MDDATYLSDMHEWDGNVAAQKKIVADLQVQADALKKVAVAGKKRGGKKGRKRVEARQRGKQVFENLIGAYQVCVSCKLSSIKLIDV